MPRTLKTSWRSAHGNARAHGRLVVIESTPIDELSEGVPDTRPVTAPARNAKGQYQAGHPETVAAARHAARCRKGNTALASTLAVDSSDPSFQAKLRQAEAFRRAHVGTLAATVGGGQCDAAAQASVASAALALAGSRYAYSKGELALGARLAAEARQHLIAAHELAARSAEARRRADPASSLRGGRFASLVTRGTPKSESASASQPEASTRAPKGTAP